MSVTPGYISHVEIDDDLFGRANYIDVREQNEAGNAGYNLVPQGIVFNINNDDVTSDYAVIRGQLRGFSLVADWTLRRGEVHHLSFDRIYATDTNARGIKILG